MAASPARSTADRLPINWNREPGPCPRDPRRQQEDRSSHGPPECRAGLHALHGQPAVLPWPQRRLLHAHVNHSVEYVRGHVHSNGIENFWSLLKRTIKGTYVPVDPHHLHAYVGEQTFRFNERKDNDLGRFRSVLGAVGGKRLT